MAERGRLLITGGSGLLALNWACAMRERFEVLLLVHRRGVRLAGAHCIAAELEDADSLVRLFRRHAPDIVLHTAGIADVDACEREPQAATRVNAEISGKVAQAASACGASLVHISTDHLFSGEHAFTPEEEPPAPINAYARSKALAERQVAAAHPRALIVRTNFFGWGPPYRRSFSDWVIDNLRANRPLTLFADAFITPILAGALAAHCHALLDRRASGIFNVVGDERISKHDFGLRIAERFGLPVKKISRGNIRDAHLTAPRPKDMSLANAKARFVLGHNLGSVDAFLESLEQQETDGRAEEIRACVGSA